VSQQLEQKAVFEGRFREMRSFWDMWKLAKTGIKESSAIGEVGVFGRYCRDDSEAPEHSRFHEACAEDVE
jgi:hypothetical protein